MLKDELITGIDDIDEQHGNIFRLVGQLKKPALSYDSFLEILISLENYVVTHFQTEEGYMKSLKYSGYDEHKQEHDKFLGDYKSFLSTLGQADDYKPMLDELIVFLGEWLAYHYTNEDVKMAVYIKKHINN